MLRIIRKLVKNDEGELAVLALGANAMMGTRYKAVADILPAGGLQAGGKMRAVSKWTDNVATFQAWASGMTAMNQLIRGSFGVDFIRQVGVDVADYKNLTASMKTFYARHGIDGEMAARIARRLDEDNLVIEGFKFPRSSAWADKDPGAWDTFRQAVQGAGDEALIDPSLGDQVFLRHYPMGRLLMQFQGFAYSALNKLYRPMVQEVRLHPTNIRPYFAAVLAIQMGSVSDFIRHAIRGEAEQWIEDWETLEGTRDRMYAAFIRSPLAIGPLATLTDVFAAGFGGAINDMLQASGAGRVFPQASTKFREQQAFAPLLGPTMGQVNTLGRLGRTALEIPTDPDAFGRFLEQASRRTPLFNVFYLQGASRLLSEGD